MGGFDVGWSLKALVLRSLRYRLEKVRSGQLSEVDEFLKLVRPVSTDRPLIRIGGNGDGGYLIPDDLDGVKYCFSPGVSTTASFEENLIARGVKCFLADYSVVDAPIENEAIVFTKKFIGPKCDDMFMTLKDWVDSSVDPAENDLILQMDIEGAEYESFIVSDESLLARFRIIVVEFHRLDALFNKMGFKVINGVFQKILRNFDVVHIHPNNGSKVLRCGRIDVPPTMEFTFLRKDRIGERRPTTTFPNQLDRTNVPDMPDFPLPGCWYENGRGS
ncbi:FkbM family methyltransferase [Aminobacter sp. LjRoot7]|uniref:FkbM family methyltransferase n=1 Tax=Aminobacter sp. LjRoot7 TaxID=3342335 RepID=UPI003ECE7E5D